MILWWSLVALLGGAGPASAAPQGAPSKPVEWIFIDGAKQPWLLPEWLVWDNIFSGVSIIRSKKLENSPLDSLAVTRAELIRIENAASWYDDHTAACAERQTKEVARLRAAKRPSAEVVKRQREVIIECREEVLDVADALLRDMSDDSRVALLAYVESTKPGMWARTARSELEFFRLPR